MTLFFVNVFKRFRFLQSTRLEMDRFQNDALSNDSTFETVFETILHFNQLFGRFSVVETETGWVCLFVFLFFRPTEKNKNSNSNNNNNNNNKLRLNLKLST